MILRSDKRKSNVLCVFLAEEEPQATRKIAYYFAGWRFITRYLWFKSERRKYFQSAVSCVVGRNLYDANVFVCVWEEARKYGGNIAEVENKIIKELAEARKFYNRHHVKIRGWYNEFG